jgi:hypothetical protein
MPETRSNNEVVDSCGFGCSYRRDFGRPLSPSDPDGDLRSQDVQKNAADGQGRGKGQKDRKKRQIKGRSARPLFEMRKLDAAKKRLEIRGEQLLLFGQLHGKVRCRMNRFPGRKQTTTDN